MNSTFHPSFNGVYHPESMPDDFLDKIAERIASGLFPLAPPSRNRYEVVERTDDSLRFRSRGLLTGINIGLNDVRLRIDGDAREIRYEVSYWTWAKYSIYLCLGIGGLLGIVMIALSFGWYIFPMNLYPSNYLITTVGLPMIIFWGLIFPWILIALHKRPASRCLMNIFDEANDFDEVNERK